MASVPVDAHNGTAFVLKALLILNVLLNAPPEETLHGGKLKERCQGHSAHTESNRCRALVSVCRAGVPPTTEDTIWSWSFALIVKQTVGRGLLFYK